MEEKRFDEEIEIDLLELIGVLWEKAVWIISSTVLFALIALLATQFLITPMYESTASIYIINRQSSSTGSASSSDLSAATSLTYDFEEMVTTNLVLEPTIRKLNLDLTTGQLKQRITVNNPKNTRILEITVTDEDPKRAKRIVDTLADISADAIVDVMEIEKVNSIDKGVVAKNPSSPNTMKNTAIGAMGGMVLACGIVVMKFLLDDTIKTDEDVERYLGVSVLGSIPDMEHNKVKRKKIRYKNPKIKGKGR